MVESESSNGQWPNRKSAFVPERFSRPDQNAAMPN